MPHPSLRRPTLRVLALLGPLAALAIAAAPASAAPFNCDSSAIRITLGGTQTIEPVTANHGQTACKNDSAGLTGLPAALPLPLTLSAVSASTSVAGAASNPSAQSVQSQASLAKLTVGALPALPITIPLPTVPPVPVTTPLGSFTIDINPTLQSLLPNGGLPTGNVLGLNVASASATGVCLGGNAQLTATSQVAGLTVLGQQIPTDQASSQAIQAVGGGSIDPSQINPSQIPLPANLPAGLPLATLYTYIQQALDALPNIPIPATLAQVSVTPNFQALQNGRLVRDALKVAITIGGQPVLDLVAGEAAVSGAGQPCASLSGASPSQAQLQCTTRKLVLVDVLRKGNRVRLFGAADKRYIGKRVSIVFRATGQVVARPKVAKDGSFTATAPLPPRSIRATNRARYQARIGKERSLDLKLVRRLVVTRLVSRNGRVTIQGRVIRPLASPVHMITVKRRISCKSWRIVKRIKPGKNGAFRVNVAAPPTGKSAVYRLSTQVRKVTTNPKTYPTFTLPRAVALLR
jgi:hypothetical protein